MTTALGAIGTARGNPIRYDEAREQWVMPDGSPIDEFIPCAKCGRGPVPMRLPDESGRWHTALVDSCLYEVVRALNGGGVATVLSCCGHGAERGYVLLADGRRLHIEATP